MQPKPGMMATLVALLLTITAFAQPTVTVYTNKPDYQPGDTVIIEGDGWLPDEQVKLEIDHSTITHGNTLLYAKADANGHILNNEFVIQPIHFGESFTLVATGISSGLTASTVFTDAETQPAAQALPYSQSFSSLVYSSTTYPAGWQGWRGGTFSSSSFRTNSATGDESLIASSSASNATAGVHNYNGKMGILAGNNGSTDPAIVLAVNTTGLSNIVLGFSIMTIRNPYDGSANTRINQVDVQYRIGTSGSFTSISGLTNGVYQSNTTTQTGSVTTPQNLQSLTYILPAACNNKANVQIRWVQRDFSGTGTRPSFAIDDVSVANCVTVAITTPPTDQTATYGDAAANFTVAATGTNLIYQWQLNTGSGFNNIDGQTGSTLTIANPNTALSGYNYRVMVSNVCSNLTSAAAKLTVNKRNITITADAKGKTYGDADPALTYQITSGSLAFSDAFTGALSRLPGEDVGSYAIQQNTVALNANYTLSYVGGNLSISQRAVTITADAKGKTYGDGDPALTYQITSGSLAFSDAFTGALSRLPGEDVGSYAIQQNTVALNANYTLSYVGDNLSISKRAVTITADAKGKTYGDGDPALTYQITSGSLAFSDAFTGALSRLPGEDVGSYAILQNTVALNANYTLSYVGDNLSISQRAVTITADAKGKTYGDGDPALTYQITSGSLAFSDAFTGALSRLPGEAVGSYAIQQNTVALNANYTLSFVGDNLSISKRAVTITADAKGKTYGDGDPALTYQITSGSLAFSDAFTGALSRLPGEAVGSYAIQQNTVALNANYTLSYVGDNLSISKRAVTITADAKGKIYGDADPALTYQITAGSLAFSDAFTGALSRLPGEAGGSYAIQQNTVALSDNYTLSYVGDNLSISQRAVTITADAKGKTYGDADPALTYQITAGSLAFSDAFTGALSRLPGEAVGSYAIQQNTVALNANYTLSYVGDNLSISKRAVTITADAKGKTYGDADPALTYQITSGSLAFSDAFTGALSRLPGEAVGSYAIQQNTVALSDNYTLSYVGGNLSISQRAVTITADAKGKTYGDADPALTYQITAGSLAFSDAFTGALSRLPGEAVGSYAIQQNTVALNANYTLSYVGDNLSISKRTVTITADAKGKTYGDADPALTYQITSGSLAFSDAFTGVLSRLPGEAVGSYAIQQNTVALSDNYTLSYVGNNLNISKRPLTITVNNKTKVYGPPMPVFDAIVTGLVPADNITIEYGTVATVSSPIGTYPITATMNDPGNRLPNYTLTNTPGTLTVTPVAVITGVYTNVTSTQYSDAVTFTATINGGAPVVSGANGAAVSATFKVGNQVMGTVPLSVVGNNLVAVLNNKQMVEGIPGQMAPGIKTVTAIFNTPNANYGLNNSNNTKTSSLTISQENADITYTGQDYIAMPGTTATSVTVSLSATVRDLFPGADGSRGNIKNAKITFRRDNPVSGPILGSASLTPALLTDSTVGTVVTSFTYTLSNAEQSAGGANLQVYGVVDNYYTGGTSDVATTITLARPGADFVTGGGYLRNTSCAGSIAGTSNLKTNFGFNMQYNKSGTNLKGQCNIIIRSNGRIYQVKSNAVNTLVVSPTTSSGTPAYFNTKANYTDITDPLNPIAKGGNLDLTVKMNDVSNGGQGDQVSILIMNPSTSELIFSSNWNGAQTVLQDLGGGNVSVRSTPATTLLAFSSDPVLQGGQDRPAVKPFAVKVLGNPSEDQFKVNIQGPDEKISLRVIDVQGRIVEAREGVPQGTLQIGHEYRVGYYVLEVRQGNNIRLVRLVKL